MSGQDQSVAESGQLRGRVRRVDDREAQGAGIGPRRYPQVVPLDVRIVQPQHLEPHAIEVETSLSVLEMDPPVPLELRDEIDRSASLRRSTLPLSPEILEVVEGLRDEVVVRSEHEV